MSEKYVYIILLNKVFPLAFVHGTTGRLKFDALLVYGIHIDVESSHIVYLLCVGPRARCISFGRGKENRVTHQ